MKLVVIIFLSMLTNLAVGQNIENFDTGVFPPVGWQEFHSGVDGLSDSNLRAYSVPNSALFDDAFGVDTSWLVSDLIVNIPNNGKLNFWQNQNYDSYYIYHGVWVSTTGGNPSNGTYVEIDSLGPGTEDVWEQITINLNAYAGQNIYVAFKYIGDFADEWHIDNILIDSTGIVGCNPPNNFNDSTIGPDSVNLTWNPVGGELYWKIEYDLAGFTPGSGLFVYSNVPSATIKNLTPNTQYDFYIQAFCSSASNSNLSNVLSRKTECGVNGNMTLPYQEGFENITTPNTPCGWTILDANGDLNTWITDTINPNNGVNAAFIGYSASNVVQNDWMFSPGYYVSDTSLVYEFGFSYASRSGSAFPEKLAVHTVKARDGSLVQNTFFEDTAILTNNLYVDKSYTFKFNDTGIHYFGFHLFSNPDQWNLMIDDVFFRQNAIGVKENPKDLIKLYPNPTSGNINYSNTSTINRWEVLNLSGKLFAKGVSNSKLGSINLSALENGTYILILYSSNKKTIKRIIKH